MRKRRSLQTWSCKEPTKDQETAVEMTEEKLGVYDAQILQDFSNNFKSMVAQFSNFCPDFVQKVSADESYTSLCSLFSFIMSF